MGFLGTVVEFLRSTVEDVPTPEVKIDRGGEDAVTGYHFAPPGTDAPPLPGDVSYLGDDLGAGNAQALGYQDPKNAGVAVGGEHRLYARSPEGAIVGSVWLKGDGSILIANDQGSAELGADGAITLTTPEGSAELGADGAIALTTPAASAELGADGAINLSNDQGGIAVDAAGNVVATTPLGTFGAGTHTHTSPFGPTGPPIPGT
jgi:hypothetical protein